MHLWRRHCSNSSSRTLSSKTSRYGRPCDKKWRQNRSLPPSPTRGQQPLRSRITQPKVLVPPPASGTVGTCGFIQYPPAAQAIISFKAAHPNNFAIFSFSTVKGTSGAVPVACAPVPTATSLPRVSDLNVNGFLRNATSVYSKQMPVASLVGACPNGTAAFAENLSVYPLATDGWSTLWRLASYATPAAFALQPKAP